MEIHSIILARHRQNGRAVKIRKKAISYTELTLVLKGELEYSLGDRKLLVQGGDVICLPPGTMRSRKEGASPSDYVSFNFLGEGFPQLPSFIQGGVNREILFLLSAFDEEQKENYLPNTTEKTKLLILNLLLALKDQITSRETNPLVQKIVSYLHQNLENRITLDDIAEETYFSPIYCETVFKKETGRSIIDYLIDLRVDQAKLFLVQGLYSMEEIAQMTGFSDGNYFSRLFKKRTGHTPSGYRRLYQEGQKIG